MVEFSHLIIEDHLRRNSEALACQSLTPNLEQEFARLALSLQFQQEDRPEKVWRVILKNRSSERREMHVTFVLPVLQPGWKLFFPSGDAHPSWQSTALRYGYRETGTPLSMPIATVYHPDENRGMTFFGDFEIPIQRMSVTCDHERDPGNLKISRTHLRIEPDGSVETSLHVGEHEGDWRPALGLVRRRFPDFFFTKNSEMEELFGAFVFSTSIPLEEYVRRWKEEGVKAIEVHYTYPFLCKFIPTEEPFVRAMDDVWSYAKFDSLPDIPSQDASYDVIKLYIDRTALRDGSVEAIRSYLRVLKKHGLKSFMYFQPSEPWERFARKYYPDYLIRDAHGDDEPVWFENIVANPYPEGEFGKYIIEQFKQLLDLFPEMDGIFLDEACYDQLDFSHDDGFSVENGKLGYRMGYAICKLTQLLCRLARERGKMIWWNGPYQIEIAREADGMMAEGGGMQGESIQYLTIGNKPTCCLVYNERQLKRNLVLGLLPTAPSFAVTGVYRLVQEMPTDPRVDPESVDLHRRFHPLFEHLKGKTWVLSPRPLSLPEFLDGNIFQVPSGDYVVTLVSMQQSTRSNAFFWDVPVSVQLPDSGEILGVSIRLAEEEQSFTLPYERDGQAIKVRIPRFRSAGVLLFSTGETEFPRPAKEFPRATDRKVVDIFWEGRPGVLAKTKGQIKVHCVNNTNEAQEVTVTVAGKELTIFQYPRWVSLEPHERKELWLDIKGENPGHSLVLVTATQGLEESRVEIPVEIWAASFASKGLVPILTATLRFDMFTPDGAPDMRFIDENGQPRVVKDRAIYFNGHRVGSLPSRNNPFWRLLFTVPVPDPILVHVARENVVQIHADSPEDAFKVRNVSLELELVNGVRLSSTEDTTVHSSRQCEFSEGLVGNPIEVKLVFDRLDRQATRFDDWNRPS
jgi:hypothetical protein